MGDHPSVVSFTGLFAAQFKTFT